MPAWLPARNTSPECMLGVLVLGPSVALEVHHHAGRTWAFVTLRAVVVAVVPAGAA